MSTVDVIVPCYNYGEMLTDCVASILSQEEVDVRVLIVDDASPDDTEAIGRRLAADPRVTFWRHSVNRGHIATYNEEDLAATWAVLEWLRTLTVDGP